MLRHIFLFFLIFQIFYGTSYSQEWVWAHQIGLGTASQQAKIEDMRTNNEGMSCVAGFFYGKLEIGSYSITPQVGANCFVVLFDSIGDVNWAHHVNSKWLEISSVSDNNDGSFYIFGRFEQKLTIDGVLYFNLPILWDPYHEIASFVCKYDKQGKLEWAKYGANFDELIATDLNGNTCTEGLILNNNEIKPDGFYPGDSLYFYNLNGELKSQIAFVFDSNDPDIDHDILNIESYKNEFWVISENWNPYIMDNYERELGIIKYDFVSGRLIDSVKVFGVPFYDDLKVFEDDIYIIGSFQENKDSVLHFGDLSLKSNSPETYDYGEEGFFAKYNFKIRKFEWAISIENSNFYNGKGNFINIGNSGDPYIAVNNKNGYISKFNSSGELIWSKETTAYIHDYNAIDTDDSENVYLAGTASNGFSMNFGAYSIKYDTQVGFLAKLDPNPPVICEDTTLSSISLCPGESYIFGKDTITEGGMYTQLFPTVAGCDSLVILEVRINKQETQIIEIGNFLIANPDSLDYQWINCDNNEIISINNPFRPIESSSYRLKFKSNGCNYESTCLEYEITNCSDTFNQTAKICQGESYQFGDTLIYDSGTYERVFTSSQYCDSVVVLELIVDFINPKIIQKENSLICLPEGYNYKWIDCSTEQIVYIDNNIFNIENVGSYMVEVSIDGCSEITMCYDAVITNLLSSKDLPHISLFPNPSKSLFYLDVGGIIKPIDIKVLNIQGQTVNVSKSIRDDLIGIDLVELEDGIYIIKLYYENKSHTFKVNKSGHP